MEDKYIEGFVDFANKIRVGLSGANKRTGKRKGPKMAKLIDKKAIGVEISWSFGNGDAEAVTLYRETVRDIFIDSGFGDLIEDVSPSDALVRASRMAPKVRDISVKEFKRPNKDTPRSYGIYSVTKEIGESGDNFINGARVRIENNQVVCVTPEDNSFDKKCEEIGKKMAVTANKLLNQVINSDISAALLRIGHSHLFWISRRQNSGGVYYIPNNAGAEMFVKLLHDLRDVTGTYPRYQQFIPQVVEQYEKPLTVETWEGSCQDEFETKIDRLIKDLDKMNKEGKMRESTINKRADECDSIIKQAKQYKLFLKKKVQTISERLIEIQSQFRAGLEENIDAAGKAFEEIADLTPQVKPRTNRTFKTKAKKSKKKGGRRLVKNTDGIFDF